MNIPPNQNNWLGALLPQPSSLTSSSLLYSSETHKSFLHACTPERGTRVGAHLFMQHEHGHTPDTKTYPSKKIFEVQKRWVTIQAVEQVNPTAQNTLGLHECIALYHSF
jgi:hypothetical protein